MITPPTIPAFDDVSHRAALARWETRTKPSGSLGQLEAVAAQLAGIQATATPVVREKRVVIFAADHGAAFAHPEISAFPASVTAQMFANFAHGGAAICVLSRQFGATLTVVDAGVGRHNATRDFVTTNALTECEAQAAYWLGANYVTAVLPADVLALGEMGIGNTASASALLALLTGANAHDTVGRGTGVSDAGLATKRDLVAKAVALHRPHVVTAWDALCAVAGREMIALVGAMMAGAANRCAVVVDGFIVTVCALAAVRMVPELRPYLIFAHRGAEHAHRLALNSLDADPLLDLGLRLGEGSGAALALPLIESAARLLSDMAGFTDAGVDTERENA